MKRFKVVFLGTPQIGAVVLESLLANPQVEVALVVSQPDKKVGRKHELQPTAVKKVALAANIPVIQPQKISEAYEQLQSLNPDFLITCAYGQFIPNQILALPQIEALNVHGSLLPKYRGGAPIQYAIWNGEVETGVSIMRMVKKMDAGPYFSQQKLVIGRNETSGELVERMGVAGAQLLNESLPLIANGTLEPIEQDEAQATICQNISSAQEQIDWNQSAVQIHNQVRALNPSPGAFTTLNGERLKIYQTEVSSTSVQDSQPGVVLQIDKTGVLVGTQTGALKLLTLQKQGKKVSPAGVWALSNLKVGMVFDPCSSN